jgi:hypothetical protein
MVLHDVSCSIWCVDYIFLYSDVHYEYYRAPEFATNLPDPFDTVYKDLPKKHHVLNKVKTCEFCRAKIFPGEGPSFYCRKGKVHIYIPEVPCELRRLFASQTDTDAKYFRKHIRYFNSHFSFTSFGVSIDKHLANPRGSGVYVFKAHGHL